jgi:integrase
LVFGHTEVVPFGLSSAYERSSKAWDAVKLDGITFHEARHTFASILIAAGVNAKAICTYMGHSSITVTYDKYGHLMPGSDSEAIGLVDAYLERADTQARLAKVAS